MCSPITPALPILTAPSSPDAERVSLATAAAEFEAKFDRNRAGSDFLHWGEGKVSINKDSIAFVGELAPGPDYKVYLSPTYVEDEQQFLANKANMVQIGDVKTFENFLLDLPAGTDLAQFDTVVVWCESFSEFITSGQYR
ncbi:DM13 domain-containing protein [Thalassotalea sp. Y01]|uniref:DM13 domain-containing protein n=1 Tax=Thalassotalea sp. Y01 TaxID=2729613 RepID=UPI001B7D50DD|nr:DM13 domain-containing protein [Thalassotalea sp. Y01]